MAKRAKASGHSDLADDATVVTLCPDCGVIRVPARTVIILIGSGSPRTVWATFGCPTCRLRTTHRLEPAVLGALRALGVPFRLLTRPAEADERHDGPPITTAEIETFLTAMEDPTWPRSLC